MTAIVELIGAVVVAGWIFERIALLILPRRAPQHWAPAAGYGATIIAGVIGGFGFGFWVSVVAPVGAMVPLLCAAWSLTRMGWISVRPVPIPDLLVIALLCALVLAGAWGLGPVNLYAWFYAGLGPVALTVALAVWALWRGQTVVLIGLVLGQALWLMDIGSSNLYDQYSHFGLPFVLVLLALSRAVMRLLPQRG